MLSTVVSSSRQKREIRQGKRDLATEKEEQERKLTLRKREQVRKLEAREKEVTKREREVAKREKELKKERERLRVLKERLEGPETELGKSNKEATDSSDNSKKSDSDKSKESDGNNSNKSDGNSSKNGTDGDDMDVDHKPKASGYGNEIHEEARPSAGRADALVKEADDEFTGDAVPRAPRGRRGGK